MNFKMILRIQSQALTFAAIGVSAVDNFQRAPFVELAFEVAP